MSDKFSLDSFDSIVSEVNASTSLVSFHNRVVLHVISELVLDAAPQYAYCTDTCRFVRPPVMMLFYFRFYFIFFKKNSNFSIVFLSRLHCMNQGGDVRANQTCSNAEIKVHVSLWQQTTLDCVRDGARTLSWLPRHAAHPRHVACVGTGQSSLSCLDCFRSHLTRFCLIGSDQIGAFSVGGGRVCLEHAYQAGESVVAVFCRDQSRHARTSLILFLIVYFLKI